MRNKAARQGLFEQVFDIQSMKVGARSRTIAAPERCVRPYASIDLASALSCASFQWQASRR